MNEAYTIQNEGVFRCYKLKLHNKMNFPISLYTIEIRIVSVGFEVAFHPRTSNPFRSIAFAKLIFPRAHISFLLMFSAFQPYPNVKPTEGFMLALLLLFFFCNFLLFACVCVFFFAVSLIFIFMKPVSTHWYRLAFGARILF